MDARTCCGHDGRYRRSLDIEIDDHRHVVGRLVPAAHFQRNNGIRIDHLLLSAQAQDRLRTTSIRKEVRGWDKPSDHVPVIVDLDIN